MTFLNKRITLGLIGKASMTLAVFQLLSRLVGLLRDRILAFRFGAGDILDVYYAAFNIPDFVFNLLVVGAVSSAFIPVFIEQNQGPTLNQTKAGPCRKEEISASGQLLASNFLNILMLAVAVALAVIFFFAPGLVGVVAPGFSGPKKDLTILFTRVMLFSPLIFAASNVIGSLLQASNRFLAYAIAPIFYNLGIILGATVLEPRFGPLGLAEGVVLGALLHFLVQLPAVWRIGFRWRLVLDWSSAGMRKIFKLMAPRVLGLAATQINTIVLFALATMLSSGSVAIFSLANNLQYLPIALIGISVAVASFPTLSKSALRADKKDFIRDVTGSLKRVLFLVVPFSLLFFFFREEAVRIILQTGQFSHADSVQTGRVLGVFIIGIWGHSITPILSRAFYALQNTVTPVAISIVSVAANILLAFRFTWFGSWGVSGLALAFSLAGILNAVLLLIFLKRKISLIS